MVKVVNVESLSKLSGDVVDVKLFLVSRNTLGNDEPQLKLSKPKVAKCVGVGSGQVVVVAETQWDCRNAMMAFETQCESGG